MMETTVKLEDEGILAIWGSRGDSMDYEGCHGLLSNGRMCALGVIARRARMSGSYQRNAHNHGREDHRCKAVGEGISMYNFTVKT